MALLRFILASLVLGASALQPLPAAAARRVVGARCVRSRLMAAASDSAPTDGASPLDDDIISLTDESGVNSLVRHPAAGSLSGPGSTHSACAATFANAIVASVP